MRRIWLLVGLLLLPLTVARAQDRTGQPLIVALAQGTVYVVSPEDGSATPLAYTEADGLMFAPIRTGSISPDGAQWAYVIQTAVGTPSADTVADLYVVRVADGTTERITPTGGLFGTVGRNDEVFQIGMPTWSLDGQRIYYFWQAINLKQGRQSKPTLLAYYDVAKQKHVLVARIDPQHLIEDLQAVNEGLIVRWYEPGFAGSAYADLYSPTHELVDEMLANLTFTYPLVDKGVTYYGKLNDFGDLATLVDVQTGAEQAWALGHYPALESLMGGAQSMHVFYVQGDMSRYSVYGADYKTYVIGLDNPYGFSLALSPDGQSMAYLQFEGRALAPIRIVNIRGDVRELPFEAEQILWGAVRYVPFFAPG